MKLFCLLFSIYAMLLSVNPCCTGDDCQANLIIKKEQAGKVPIKEKECPGCSPFFTCGSCTGFIVSNPMSLQLSFAASKDKDYGHAYQQPHTQKIILSIWLPPKLS